MDDISQRDGRVLQAAAGAERRQQAAHFLVHVGGDAGRQRGIVAGLPDALGHHRHRIPVQYPKPSALSPQVLRPRASLLDISFTSDSHRPIDF